MSTNTTNEKENNMKNITNMIIIILLMVLTGCSREDFKNEITEMPMGVYIENHEHMASYLDVYEAWKYDIDDIYIQAGKDDYTNTYLLEEAPQLFSTLMKITGKYDMNVYALLTSRDITKQNLMNVLNYNKVNKENRFTGIHLDIEFNDANQDIIQNNLNSLKYIIDNHNLSNNDNIKLSINIDMDTIKNADTAYTLINAVDECVFIINNKNIDNLSTLMQDKNKHFKVLIDNKNMSNKELIKLIVNSEGMTDKVDNIHSFNGIILNDYVKYIKTCH